MEQVARCFLLDQDRQVFLVKHRKDGKWTLPSGHIEPGETPIQTLKRELYEELNFDIKLTGEVQNFERNNIQSFPLPMSIYSLEFATSEGEFQTFEYIYKAKLTDGSLKIQKEEIYDRKWVNLDKLKNKTINTYN